MKHHLTHTVAFLACVSICRAADIPSGPADKVVIHDTVTNGFAHPGIGLTKEILENARKQVMAKREPWHSGFQRLAAHSSSSKSVKCRAESIKNPGVPDVDAYDNKGIEGRLKQDGSKAKQQALMYIFTAEEVYRANAMNIVRVWSQMDPNKYKNYAEAHIHASYPVQDLIIAAELLRHTSARDPKLAWKEQDTRDFTSNFVIPSVNTFFNDNGWFMNQNGYPLAAAMSGDIFTNNRESYSKRVEWFTVNKTAPNKGWSSSVTHLARLVDADALTGGKVASPVVQLMEMGRDQAHAGGDVEIFMNTARQMNAQRTKVDPVTGNLSTAPNAVGAYEFLNDRILAAADQFCRFMLGYDTPWIPAPYDIGPDGEIRGIYPRIADNYRGRIRGLDFWDAHYYYTYQKRISLAEEAPYYHEAFTKRIVNSITDWIYIPAAVTGEGARVPFTEQEAGVVEIEHRFTQFEKSAKVIDENGVGFVQIHPAESGSRIAILSCDTDRKTIGMRVRTTGVAEIKMSGFAKPWLLPDTRGEWRHVVYSMSDFERLGDMVYFVVKGSSGVRVDLDSLERKTDPPPVAPEFTIGDVGLGLVAYVGAPVSLDLSAKGRGVRVSSLDKPGDATLNGETGVFQWQPKQEGEFNFLVMAEDEDTITPKKVRIAVTPDRTKAVEKIAAVHNPEVVYVEAGVKRCKALYDDSVRSINQSDDRTFCLKLAGLQFAFDQLEPLTPRLPDGSMDFPKVVVSTDIGAQIALLTDGNDDTFPVYHLAKDFNYVFDFGERFKFSATAFGMEGRLNFENRTLDTAFFGSDDSKNWTRLTPEITQLPKDMTRVEVESKKRGAQFRFLKAQKMSKKSAGLFEPSELRIHGQRHEVK